MHCFIVIQPEHLLSDPFLNARYTAVSKTDKMSAFINLMKLTPELRYVISLE